MPWPVRAGAEAHRRPGRRQGYRMWLFDLSSPVSGEMPDPALLTAPLAGHS